MSTPTHLEASLQRDIEHIRTKAAEMTALVEKGLRASLQGLVNRNRQMAYGVILRDQLVDEMEVELNQLCLEFLARQQPVAGHLRFVFAMIQINRELERIGDYAESVARQVLVLSDQEPQPDYEKVGELGDIAVHMLHDAVQAFLRQDPDLATRTIAVEERANALRNTILADIAELSAAGKLSPNAATALSTVVRRLERASDQAKNICEEVFYMCTGAFAKHRGGDKFRVLFVDAHNGPLSQMAEAIAKSLGRQEFLFASAGISPQPLDPRTAGFIGSKGSDSSKLSSKSVEQLPDFAQYQVVVSLGSNLRDALPARSTKTIHLTWLIPQISGSDSSDKFEQTWKVLENHIRDLIEAIIDLPLKTAAK